MQKQTAQGYSYKQINQKRKEKKAHVEHQMKLEGRGGGVLDRKERRETER